MNKITLYLCILLGVLSSCQKQKEEKTPPIKLYKTIEVSYREAFGNKLIPIKVNGVSMDAIFDTGASGISMSLHEIATLCKNGQIKPEDIEGTSYSKIANGQLIENAIINLQTVEIAEGIIISNVKASIILNDEAPLLLGNDVLDELSKYTIDNNRKVIQFIVK